MQQQQSLTIMYYKKHMSVYKKPLFNHYEYLNFFQDIPLIIR